MSFTYIKSINTDFPYGISAHQLRKDLIAAGITTCTVINTVGDAVTLYFSADYSASTTAINTVITNHRVVPDCFDDLKFVSITAGDSPYQMTVKSVLADASGGNITVKLPKPQRANGFYYAVEKISAAGTVTILPFASELVDGGASVVLSNYKSYLLVSSDGTNWIRASNNADVSINADMSNTTAKGDLRVDDGNGMVALPVGQNGYVLTADSTQPAGMKWAAGGSGATACTEVSLTGVVTTTSSSYVVANGMTITPAAGTYFVVFSTVASTTSSSANASCAVHLGGTIVNESERSYKYSLTTNNAMMTQAKVTVDGSTAINIRIKTSTGTLQINNRTLSIVAVV